MVVVTAGLGHVRRTEFLWERGLLGYVTFMGAWGCLGCGPWEGIVVSVDQACTSAPSINNPQTTAPECTLC
jgi:hypothetical protein